MAAVTPTKIVKTEFSGQNKVLCLSMVPTSASDTLTLTDAVHGISTILQVIAVVRTGQDANLMTAHCTFAGLVITVATLGADGLAATDWTTAVIDLIVIGY